MKDGITFLTILVVQILCTFFFLYDIVGNLLGVRFKPVSWQFQEITEISAAFGLIMGIILSAMLLWRSLRRTRVAEETVRVASGAFLEVLEERFAEWGLTPAERDVALFSVKGLSTAEIAALRNTSEGTVKAQTNAIYRKANVSGRSQLLSLFIDDLMVDALPGVVTAQEMRGTA